MRKRCLKSLVVLLVALFVSLTLYSCGGGGGGSSSPSTSGPTVIPGNQGGGSPGTTPSTGTNPSNNNSGSSSSSNSNSSSSSNNSSSSGGSPQVRVWLNGQKPNLNDVSLNNGYGTCTEDSFSWNGTIVVSQTKGAKYVALNVGSGLAYLYFDPFNNITYATIGNKAYTIDLNSSQPTKENDWLGSLMSEIESEENINQPPYFSTYIKNHIILLIPGDTDTTVYDINTAEHTLNKTAISGYGYPYAPYDGGFLYLLGKDNSSEIALFLAQDADKAKTFVYVNPNQVTINNTDIDTGYVPYTMQSSDYYFTYAPVETNGKVYVPELVSTDNSSILQVEDAVSGQAVRYYTIIDVFNTTTNLPYKYFRFDQPVTSLDGKYVFALSDLYIPSSDNSSTGNEFYFMVKINTSTNNVEGIYPVYMIKNWYIDDYTVSPDGKYIYMIIGKDYPNFEELLVINTVNGKEKAFKIYIDPNINGDLGTYNQIISWPMPSKMVSILDGSYLYIPFIMYNTPYYYITEIPTDELNNSVQ